MKYQFIFWMNVSIKLPTISAIVRPLVYRRVGLPQDGLKSMPLGGLLALDNDCHKDINRGGTRLKPETRWVPES